MDSSVYYAKLVMNMDVKNEFLYGINDCGIFVRRTEIK